MSGLKSRTTSKRRPAVRSRPCLETMLQLVGQQLHAPTCCTFLTASRQLSFSFTSTSAGQQAGMSRVTNIWEDPNYMSGLEDRLSCMWNDVWNDVKTTSSCEEQTLFGGNAATCGSATTGANMLHIQDTSKKLSTVESPGQHMERQGHMQVSFLSRATTMGGPKLCLVLRTGWAACGTMSGTTSKRRPDAGTPAHGNRQHHNSEEGSVLAKKETCVFILIGKVFCL